VPCGTAAEAAPFVHQINSEFIRLDGTGTLEKQGFRACPASPGAFHLEWWTDRLRLLRRSQRRNARNADLLLAFACLGNVVGRLHAHQRIHVDSEGLLDAKRHFP
jgi:hypothetical protein